MKGPLLGNKSLPPFLEVWRCWRRGQVQALWLCVGLGPFGRGLPGPVPSRGFQGTTPAEGLERHPCVRKTMKSAGGGGSRLLEISAWDVEGGGRVSLADLIKSKQQFESPTLLLAASWAVIWALPTHTPARGFSWGGSSLPPEEPTLQQGACLNTQVWGPNQIFLPSS